MIERRPWSPTMRYVGTTLLVGSIIAILVLMRPLLQPLLVAALLAYVLNPIVDLLIARTRLGHQAAVALVFIFLLLAILLIALALVPLIVSQTDLLVAELDRIEQVLRDELKFPMALFGIQLRLDRLLDDFESAALRLLEPERLLAVLQTTGHNLLSALVVLVTTFYLLRDWAALREWLIGLAPPREQADVRRLYLEMKKIWQAYLRGQLVLMLIVGLLTTLGLLAIGLPGAVAIGVLSGLLDVILSVGPAVAMLVAVIVALFEGSLLLPISNGWFALLVVAIYVIIQTAENVWFRPRIIGYRLQIHPGLVFLAIIFALTLFGVLVTLLIVPLMGTVALVGRYVRARLLNTNPWPEPSNQGLT